MALRIFHTADWHLGHSLHGLPRDFEQACFLDLLLDALEERQADSLLIAGHLFDSANPPASAQAMLYRFLIQAGRRLPGLQVVMIAGNHDSAARLEAPSPILDALCLALFDRMPRLPGGRGVEVGRADDVPESRLRRDDVRSILRRGAGEGYAEVDFRGVDGGRYRARWSVRRARPGPVGCASRRAAGAPGQGRPMATAGGAGGKPAARSRRSWSGNRRCGSCGSTCAS